MVRVRRWIAAGIIGGLCITAIACGSKPNTSGNDSQSPSAAELGGTLYKAEPMPKLPNPESTGEPIVIPAVVQNDIRVQIPAQVDGVIEIIATPYKQGMKADPADLIYHPRDTKREFPQFVRLRDNDPVVAGQELARQDEQLIVVQIASTEKIIEANKLVVKENENAKKYYAEQLDALSTTAGTAKFERLTLMATVARLQAEVIQTQREQAKAEGELLTANAQLRRHFVKSPMNGRIVKLLKSPGDFAKTGEVIMEMQATDRVRVEGKLDIQYTGQVRRGMRAMVEPARPVGPHPLANYHRQEVTSVAVTGHKPKPMVVSGGLDGNALVWDLFDTKISHRLPHPTGVGVRSVACTGTSSGAKQLAITGGDDGKVRLWDLSNPKQLPKEPTFVFEDNHTAAVTSATLSPNGQYLATAAGREVFIWDIAGRKKLYTLPAEHKDSVTSMRFTPQCTLVTVARDRFIRVWSIRDKGATQISAISHRAGAVDILGVSTDGSKVLFDKDPSRLDIVSLVDERTVGTLQSPGGAARFATLAIFSPAFKTDDKQWVLTAGGDTDQKSELTIWEAPQAGGRGSERLRLMAPRGAAVTCASFSPDPDNRFVVVGTADGGVHYWTTAAIEERGPAMWGEVVFVQQTDARSATVRVEMDNPIDKHGQGLQDRSLATIIIDPTAPIPVAPILPVPPGQGPRAEEPKDGGIKRVDFRDPANPKSVLVPVMMAPAPLPPAFFPGTSDLPMIPDPTKK